jgi:hypothetical protein
MILNSSQILNIGSRCNGKVHIAWKKIYGDGPPSRKLTVIHGSALFFYSISNNLRSGATSLFDVRRWTFDVGRSSFNTMLFSD